LKVVHVPYTFAPDPVGGTEIYVEALCHELQAHDIESLIIAPSNEGAEAAYEHSGLRVCRLPSGSSAKRMLHELYGEGDPSAAARFAKILDDESPDAIHMHAFTRTISVLFVRAAKQRGLPVFFTYHTPTVSCQRGDLNFRDKEICDGTLDVHRCTRCYAESLGVPQLVSSLLSHIPFSLGRAVGSTKLSRMWMALQLSELVRKRQAAFHELMQAADGVVAVSDWVRTLLLQNGVPSKKIVFSRHGLFHLTGGREPNIDSKGTPLRVCFLGRGDARKGSATLVNAMKLIPDVNIELHLYGIMQSATSERDWWAQRDSHGDGRISFFDAVPHDMIVPMLRNYHLVAVPSQYVETGPLVVLESLAAGTPVIGSNFGGIAEWIRHEENGLLVQFKDVQGWADAICRCAEDRSLLERLRRGINVRRSMQDVAAEMAQMYLSHLKRRQYPLTA
jgi:glycosyltransferase involved in cell wall biosynthesis